MLSLLVAGRGQHAARHPPVMGREGPRERAGARATGAVPGQGEEGAVSRLRLGRVGWLNAGLVALLGLVVFGAYTAIGAATPTSTTTTRTATVTQGSLTATVTGSGNIGSARSASLSFGAGGTVQSLGVGVGDKVSKGDELASIDTASARRSLAAAKASLASADASYDEAVDGSSTAGTADSISAAKLSLTSARQGVTAAGKQLTNDTKTQNALVSEAEAAYTSGKGTKSQLLAAEATRSQTLARDRQGITQAEAQVATARSNLAKAEAGGSSSSSSTASVASAKVQVADAEASVAEAQDALDDTKIVAPFSGTILSVAGDVGDSVSSGTSSSSSGTSSSGSSSSGSGSAGTSGSSSGSGSSGTTSGSSSSSSSSSSAFITMASTSKLEVTANVAEADIGSVKVGQDASITLSASSATAEGTVTQVAPEGTTSSNVVQYPVTISLTTVPKSARIGSTASVTITTGSADDAILLLTSAITTSGTRSTVQLMKNGVATTTVVQTGLAGSTQTQITSGLSVGNVVRIPTTTASTGTGGGLPGFGGGFGR